MAITNEAVNAVFSTRVNDCLRDLLAYLESGYEMTLPEQHLLSLVVSATLAGGDVSDGLLPARDWTPIVSNVEEIRTGLMGRLGTTPDGINLLSRLGAMLRRYQAGDRSYELYWQMVDAINRSHNLYSEFLRRDKEQMLAQERGTEWPRGRRGRRTRR